MASAFLSRQPGLLLGLGQACVQRRQLTAPQILRLQLFASQLCPLRLLTQSSINPGKPTRPAGNPAPRFLMRALVFRCCPPAAPSCVSVQVSAAKFGGAEPGAPLVSPAGTI